MSTDARGYLYLEGELIGHGEVEVEPWREFIPVPLRTMDPPLRVTTSGDSGRVPTLTFLDDLPHFSPGRTYTHDFATGAFWVTPEPEPLPVFRSLLDLSAAFPAARNVEASDVD